MSAQSNDNNYPRDKFYSLFKVLGYGVKDNFSISSNNINGLISWIAGPYLIFYDIKTDKQVSFLKNQNNKIISCVKFSSDGKLIATGEGNCKNSEISIYEIEYKNETQVESHKLYTSFKNHKYGIEKLLFFKNDNYLVSIGDKEDKIINIFNLIDNTVIYSTKYNRTILSFDICDNFMVQCGDRYIKMFNFEKMFDLSQRKGGITKTYVELSQLKESTFISVLISQEHEKIYFLTFDGFLAEMKFNGLVLVRWMHLRKNRGLSFCVFDKMLACGCTDGIIRLFNAETLAYVITLHRPPPLGKANIESNVKKVNMEVTQDAQFADIISIFYSIYHKKLVTIYSDKTFFVWNLEDMKKFLVYRYSTVHCGSITSLDYQVEPAENVFKMVTGSDDRTVIYWNLKLSDLVNNSINQKPNHIAYSRDIRHIFYFGNNKYDNFKISAENPSIEKDKKEIDDKDNHNGDEGNELTSITCVKFSPNKKYLACGDNLGNVHIFSLSTFKKVKDITIHDGSVNAIDMFDDTEKKRSYLATGSDDNILSVINTSSGLEKEFDIYNNSLFETHNSPIISVLFCYDKNKQIKLLTGETDSTINFYLLTSSSLQLVQKFYDNSMKTYCMAYCPKINKIISGHNGKITIWKTSTCVVHKHFQVNKGDKQLDNFRIACDSKGLMFATSNNDKIIRIRLLHDGQLLAKIPIAESISSLGFAMNDNYLIATSVEGYIYFYKISSEYVNTLSTDNNLINSTEEKTKINNKLRLLEKLTKNDVNMSKNDQVKYLMTKMQNSEDLTFEDLKILDSYFKEGKNKQKPESQEDKKKNEIIQLKEEQPNNNDDIENENNEIDADQYLTKSKIWEKGLKEMKINSGDNLKKSMNRISLADTYNKNKKQFGVNLSKEIEVKKEDLNSNANGNDFKMKIPKIKIVSQQEINNEKDAFNPFIHPKSQNKDNVKLDQNININELPQQKKEVVIEEKENEKGKEKEKEKKTKIPIEQQPKKGETTNEVNQLQSLIRKTNQFVDEVDSQIKLTEEENEDTPKKKQQTNKQQQQEEEEKENVLNINDINLISDSEANKFKDKYNNLNINDLINQERSKITEEIKEEIEPEDIKNASATRCDVSDSIVNQEFSGRFEENSKLELNLSHKSSNLIVTQSNFDINSLSKKSIMIESLSVASQEKVELIYHRPKKSSSKVKAASVECLSKETPSMSLMKNMKRIEVNKLNEAELKSMVQELEKLGDKINIKLNTISPDPTIERLLEKYSVLLLNKIDNKK